MHPIIQEPDFQWKALAKHVLAAAKTDETGLWGAYIGTAAGRNRAQDAKDVARYGAKLPAEVAFALFPEFKQELWRA